MKKLFTFLFLCAFIFSKANDLAVENKYNQSFKKAYIIYPSIPKGVLEAVSFTQTRFEHLDNSGEPSCIGYPKAYTLMGLIADGKNYFRNNLTMVSQLSGYGVEQITESPELSVLAYAKAFNTLQQQKNCFGNNLKNYTSIFIALSELPLNNDLQNDFAMNSHLYQLYWFLNQTQFQESYDFPNYNLDLRDVFGNNYNILSSKNINITTNAITNEGGLMYKLSNNSNIMAAPDYPPAIWDPTTCNYSSRNGSTISAVTIHFVQGSYAGCISWFKNCSANASAHYVIRSSDGQVTQMVLESNKAWHVGSENPYTVGIEHEGYIASISWFTNAMYNSSGVLTRDICNDNSINKLRTYFGASCSGTSQQCLQGTCVKVKGHQMYPNQTHTDPGPNWNWERFYRIINNTFSITATYTASTGSFFDTGGSGANYSNDERKFWLFTKPGANNITLSFTNFNLENNYDYLFIYNGGSINSPLVGVYTGTVSPGPLVSVNDSILVEFRSDCATTAAGWLANYTMNGTITPTPTDNIAPTTQVNTTNPWKTAAFTASITDVDNVNGTGVEKGYYQVIDNNGTEWRANYTKGFLADNFDNNIHPEWTQAVGTWTIQNNALVQTDEASGVAGNTNIYASLTQSLSNRYLYHFLAKFEGTGNTRRGGLHFACDNPTLPNRNNSYFVWFRLDDQKVEIYKTVNDVIGAPKISNTHTFSAGQWYDIKVIFDRITGKISIYWNNSFLASWTDNTPYQTGTSVSFRSGNCKMSIDEIKVYRSRPATVNVNVGTGLANELRYQNTNPANTAGKIKSICQDSAGNLSSIFYHNLDVDWTTPNNIPFVNDGVANDIAVVNTTDSLRANWGSSFDTNSAIGSYWYSIGTSPGATNTKPWTQNWAATSVTAKTLTLVHNTIYYFNVRAENGAGLLGNIISSNGQKVDTTSIITALKDNLYNNLIAVYPNPFKNTISVAVNLLLNKNVKITLNDVLGRVITSLDFTEDSGKVEKTISTSNLATGAYFLKFEVDDKIYRYKVIKE